MSTIASSALFLSISDVATKILGFVATLYLTRIIAPEAFGLITIGTSFLTIVLLISDCGMRTFGTVEHSSDQSHIHFEFHEFFKSKAIHTIWISIVLGASVMIIYRQPQAQAICLLYLFNSMWDILYVEWYVKAHQRFGTLALSKSIMSLLYCILLYFFITNSRDVLKVPVLFFLSNMVGACILLISIPRAQWKSMALPFNFKTYTNILTHSLYVGIGTVFMQIPVYIPVIMVSKLCSFQQAGFLGASIRIISVFMIADRIFSSIFLTNLPKKWQLNTLRAKELLQQCVIIIIPVGFCISLCVSVLSKEIISVVFGNQYAESSQLLCLSSWFIAATMMNSLFGYGLIGIGKKKEFLHASLYSGIIAIGILMCLTLYTGAIGAAIGMSIAEACTALMYYLYFNTWCSLRVVRIVLTSMIASCISFFVGTMLPIPLKLPVTLLSFTGCIFLMGAIQRKDITAVIPLFYASKNKEGQSE